MTLRRLLFIAVETPAVPKPVDTGEVGGAQGQAGIAALELLDRVPIVALAFGDLAANSRPVSRANVKFMHGVSHSAQIPDKVVHAVGVAVIEAAVHRCAKLSGDRAGSAIT